MPLLLAIRITTCIPFFYTPIEYEGEYYVDGGLLGPFPNPIPEKTNNGSIGLILQNDIMNGKIYDNRGMNIIEYGWNITNVFFNHNMRESIRQFAGKVIYFNTNNADAIELDVSDERKNILFLIGKQMAKKYLKKEIKKDIEKMRRHLLKEYFNRWKNWHHENKMIDSFSHLFCD
jgi:predicted patatin/cPLA2 family phospholipase